ALEVRLEEAVARYRSVEADIEQKRDSGSESQEAWQRVQASFYSLGSEISRIEQSMEYQRQRKQQLEEDLRNTTDALARAQRELTEDLDRITALDEEVTGLEPMLQSAREQEVLASASLEEAEHAMGEWQARWEQFNQESANTVRKAEVEQQRINHLENIVDRGNQRRQNLSRELEGLATDPESEHLAT